MATFRKRYDLWQARIQRKGYPALSKSFKLRSDAVAWARQVELDIDGGAKKISTSEKSPLLRELLIRYKSEITTRKKHPQVEAYRINAWLKQPIADLCVNDLRSSDLAKWRNSRVKLGCSPNTIRLELAIISNLYTVAEVEWGYERLSNPALKVKLPKLPPGRSQRVSEEQVELIVNNTRSRILGDIILLALETAMRRSELTLIEWSHIDLEKKTLFLPITKNGDSRMVPLSSRALALLRAIRGTAEGRVFDITEHAITSAFSRACVRSGIENITFHDLRHEAISRLFEKGLSLPEVATISGHKTWAMLRRYTHLSAEKIANKLQ